MEHEEIPTHLFDSIVDHHSSNFDVHRHLTSTLRPWFALMASVARHNHRHVDNLGTRNGPVESLARSDLDPSSSLPLRAMDIKLARRASTFNSLTTTSYAPKIQRSSCTPW